MFTHTFVIISMMLRQERKRVFHWIHTGINHWHPGATLCRSCIKQPCMLSRLVGNHHGQRCYFVYFLFLTKLLECELKVQIKVATKDNRQTRPQPNLWSPNTHPHTHTHKAFREENGKKFNWVFDHYRITMCLLGTVVIVSWINHFHSTNCGIHTANQRAACLT